MVAGAAVYSSLFAVFAIKIEVSVSENYFGFGINPPVQQIEMMRSFVQPKRTAEFAFAMPAAEIISAMTCVEISVKINRSDFANFTFTNQFPNFSTMR